jgi:ligand-binding SRPBCC domain-containing protein
MHFEYESRIAAPPSVVFAFHESPGALLKLTPPWERVKLLSGGDSLLPGSRVVLRVWIGPVPVVWEAVHTHYEPGCRFADCQVRGPFAQWTHAHLFLDDGAGGTILRDEVSFVLPFGPLGRWLWQGSIYRKLRKLFQFRHETTRRLVESNELYDVAGSPGRTSVSRDSETSAQQRPTVEPGSRHAGSVR